MATIKGQNLRIALNGKCISASQSCTLHVQMTAQDKSTKDSENDWVENEIVGAQWDVSADALVTDGIIDGGTVKCTKNIATGKYVYPQIYKLNAGDTVTLTSAASGATIYVFSGSTILAQATTAGISYTATEAINISIQELILRPLWPSAMKKTKEIDHGFNCKTKRTLLCCVSLYRQQGR